MTLIPLMTALVASPRTASAAGSAPLPPRGSYDPGAGHRPVAALLAVGLPAALVLAVALSPMIVNPPPRIADTPWTSILLPKPKPEPKPDPKPQSQPQHETSFTAPQTKVPPVTDKGPVVAPEIPYVPPAGTGSGPAIERDPPQPPPALVLAQLDGRYAGAFQPDYPSREQRLGVEGVARVRVLIGTDGRVKAVELLSTDSAGFFEETRRRALSKWRFKPATRGGVAEESWKVMTVRFEIKAA